MCLEELCTKVSVHAKHSSHLNFKHCSWTARKVALEVVQRGVKAPPSALNAPLSGGQNASISRVCGIQPTDLALSVEVQSWSTPRSSLNGTSMQTIFSMQKAGSSRASHSLAHIHSANSQTSSWFCVMPHTLLAMMWLAAATTYSHGKCCADLSEGH
jgi:hypothetical protein